MITRFNPTSFREDPSGMLGYEPFSLKARARYVK